MVFLTGFPDECPGHHRQNIDEDKFKAFLLKIGYKIYPNNSDFPLYKEEQTLEPFPDIPISKILLENINYNEKNSNDARPESSSPKL